MQTETNEHVDEASVKKPIFYRPYIESIIFILLITLIGWEWGSFLGLVNMGMLFLLPVLYTAVRWGFNGGIFSALSAIIAFDLFVVPPLLSFSVTDLRYLISFSIYLLIGAYTGKLSSRLREQVSNSRKREAQTLALYSLSREITAISDLDCVLESVIKKIIEILGGQVAIFLPNISGDLILRAYSASIQGESNLDEREKTTASWVYEHKQIAGKGTNNFGDAKGTYLPLISEQVISGVIGVIPLKSWKYLQPEQKRLLEAFASLTALAVNRISLVEKVREAQLLNESDKLRNALLNSISHDLRTPLASMIGAVTSLIEDHLIYDEQSRMDLLQTIQQGAMRMNRLVNNLLDMARLESGMLKLNKQWCDMEEIIGAATDRLGSAWKERHVVMICPEGMPLINVDFVLIEQVVVNLLDNALKYSNPTSEIDVCLSRNDHEMRFTVRDSGAQIPEEDLERIFDKFYRVRAPRQISGTGLGLAISKGIVELHDGRIWAENCANGGVAISFFLPLETVDQNTVFCMGVHTS
jgi:two-component system, OmpR family, sensor histidine kinase KdpD